MLDEFCTACPEVSGISTADVYFLELAAALEESEMERLLLLLRADAEGGLPPPGAPSAHVFYVMPRRGTISAWSSKATDILHTCGLDKVARIERGHFYRAVFDAPPCDEARLAALVCDRMTEQIFDEEPQFTDVFEHVPPRPLKTFAVDDAAAFARLNREQGYAMSDEELARLADYYRQCGRRPSDAELMMFAQVNSEHCRHKLFNAEWTVGGVARDRTLFGMIRQTSAAAPDGILSAYDDNAAVLEGARGRLQRDPHDGRYVYSDEQQGIAIKVETHNHPTAISPWPGAATGAGGEIRDEAAVGRGGRPKAGLTGFCVSNLEIPGWVQPWERAAAGAARPAHIASPLQIMIEAPLGAAAFNNEFGRPATCGYFRTFEQVHGGTHWAYHKPIMLAGGLGSLCRSDAAKKGFAAGTPLVVIGGPALLIGLGGGSASSLGGGTGSRELDFASVQRDNAQMQRRCQEVIERCTACDENPILSIHDVGAGGLSNALPELVHDAGLGAVLELDKIPRADGGLSPMELWCNEAQERYVAAIDPRRLDAFVAFCRRERCPVAVVGRASAERRIVLQDASGRPAVDMPMEVLFGYLPPLQCAIARHPAPPPRPTAEHAEPVALAITVDEAARRVLTMPAVASKAFLITIGDRSVGGLIARDQMVGPWQVPVADVAVSAAGYHTCAGEAMAVGERPPVALIDAAASARVAVSEAILNILAADVLSLHDVKLSANWMVAADEPGQSQALFEAVKAVTDGLCRALGIAIPVGKDSVSMRMQWGESKAVAPLSLVVSAFAPVADVCKTLTPQLLPDAAGARLFLIDLAAGDELGGSCLMQAFAASGGGAPDLKDSQSLAGFARLMRLLRERDCLLAYHDRSDGGLFACLAEMAFAGHCGVDCDLGTDGGGVLQALFSEGPGVVVQLTRQGAAALPELAERCGVAWRDLGAATAGQELVIRRGDEQWSWPVMQLKRWWSEPSLRIRLLRDNPQCARDEVESDCDAGNPGLSAVYAGAGKPGAPAAKRARPSAVRPKFAILREQGINGYMEMAAAFEHAGFAVYDVHTSDLIEGRTDINSFNGIAVCGGFSYGDVLGAGTGWAGSVLFHGKVRRMFEAFFSRDDTLTLGVCNGCQMLTQLREVIPGSDHWPRFERNTSERFESRLSRVEITPSPSVFLAGMEGAQLPIVVAHGEGRAVFDPQSRAAASPFVCMRYTDNHGRSNPDYPYNPNGSSDGITGLCNTDGRVTIMMPHPERVFKSMQLSWRPPQWKEESPWGEVFSNARRWF